MNKVVFKATPTIDLEVVKFGNQFGFLLNFGKTEISVWKKYKIKKLMS